MTTLLPFLTNSQPADDHTITFLANRQPADDHTIVFLAAKP